jgi:hypothetical protein
MNATLTLTPHAGGGKIRSSQWLFENEEQQWLTSIAKKIKIEERKNMLVLLPPKCFSCAIMVKEGTKN